MATGMERRVEDGVVADLPTALPGLQCPSAWNGEWRVGSLTSLTMCCPSCSSHRRGTAGSAAGDDGLCRHADVRRRLLRSESRLGCSGT